MHLHGFAHLIFSQHRFPTLAGHRPADPPFGVVKCCPNCHTVGGAGRGSAIGCSMMKGSLDWFQSRFTCVVCLPGNGAVIIDTNSDAGNLAKALLCECDVAKLSALTSRDATLNNKLQKRRQQARDFRAKLPRAHRAPKPGDGLLSLNLGETGERLKKRVKDAAAKLAAEEG
jgi:hypothetical protein